MIGCAAEEAEDMEGWVDAFIMAAHIASGKRLQNLALALTAPLS